jgi:hypothetical protein
MRCSAECMSTERMNVGLLSSTNERKKHIGLTYHMSYEYIIAYLIGVKIGK